MAVDATVLRTPERARDALATQLHTSSPTSASDDDTISNNSFDTGSDHFAFTPKHSAKVPRAWERKPSTPFAPRTETQKIWKRVPLQDKSSNGAVEIRANEKEEADSRGVKRVRLTVPDSGNGKENYANTQWDRQCDDAKRKMPNMYKNVPQSTHNSLSPLRRDSSFNILNDPPPPTALELETERVIRRLSQMQEEGSRGGKTDTATEGSPATAELKKEAMRAKDQPQQLQAECLGEQAPQTSSSLKNEAKLLGEGLNVASGDAVAITPSTSGFFTDSIIFDDQDSESEIDEPAIAQQTTPNCDMSDSWSVEGFNEGSADIKTAPEHSPLRLAAQLESLEIPQIHLDSSSEAVEKEVSQSQVDGMGAKRVAKTETKMPTDERETTYESATAVLNGYESVPDLMDTAEYLFVRSETDAATGTLSSNVTVSEFGPIDAEPKNEESETCVVSGTNLEHNEVSLEAVTDLQVPTEANLQEAAVTNTTALDTITFGAPGNVLGSKPFTPQAPTILAPETPPSDDTTYLHDFLTRARAQKAARSATSPEKMGVITSSPAKHTRQALANLSTNPASPSKSAQTVLKPDERMEDELNEDQATSPCRRSSRPRLPKPQKSVVPAVPNTIPVRRSNGTEFVFLQRTEAMQIALATRTNTKRNKGEALPPSARLETIASCDLSPIKERKKGSNTKKMVRWNEEKLTEEQLDAVLEDQALVMKHEPETNPEAETKAEKRINETEKSKKEKKKVKRLGTVNGTPAPKEVMAATTLPVPKRTLRARTKI